MSSRVARDSARLRCAFVAVLCLLMAAWAQSACGQGAAPVAGAAQPDASLETYRQHLLKLEGVVAACRKQRVPDACNPALVGADDQVRLGAVGAALERPIRYGWLRELLDRAAKKEEPQKEITGPVQGVPAKPVTIDTLLGEAGQRLEDDLKQAGGTATGVGASHAAERKSIATILAERAYQGASRRSAWDRFQEWLENLLARIFGHLIGFGARSPWIAVVLRWLLVGALCVGLVWALVRIERRSRVRLVPEMAPAAGAPSAREWQLWFQDAQRMATQGQWRDAIHFLYWAAISRLESRRMWPADRARTPREYLRLFPATDARRDNLTALTGSFERTWYGGREAGAPEFEAALKMAAGLGVE